MTMPIIILRILSALPTFSFIWLSFTGSRVDYHRKKKKRKKRKFYVSGVMCLVKVKTKNQDSGIHPKGTLSLRSGASE